MKPYQPYCIVLLCAISIQLNAQKVNFRNSNAEITANSNSEVLYQLMIDYDSLELNSEYIIHIKIDKNATTILPRDYSLTLSTHMIKTDSVTTSGSAFCLISIFRDTLANNVRDLKINLSIENKSTLKSPEISSGTFNLNIKPYRALVDYSFLTFIGTNLDLVDGVQANKVFFASNIFLPNYKSASKASNSSSPLGLYFSLYGNRPFSYQDTSTSGKIPISVELAQDSVNYNVGSVSAASSQIYDADNIGAQCSFLFRLGKLSKETNKIQIWWAPNFEFIWRRSTTEISIIRGNDTVYDIQATRPTISNQNDFTINTNQFDFSYGVGLFFNHESDKMILRFQFAIGGNTTYVSNNNTELNAETQFTRSGSDWSFIGKLWIVEPVTGISLQGEVSNAFKNPRPFYSVSLSKAFRLEEIAGLFKSIAK